MSVSPTGANGGAATDRHEAQGLVAATVRMAVVDVTPSTPVLSRTPKNLDIEVRLTNLGTAPLTGLRLSAVRDSPLGSQRTLDASLAANAPTIVAAPYPITPREHVPDVDLPAGATVTAVFPTTTDIVDRHGICLCHNAVYPLVLTAYRTAGGVSQPVARAETYLPSFYRAPAPVQVHWVWPLLDRPRRGPSDTVFSDDTLASSVAGDGRLSRALQVVEQAPPGAAVSLLVDPDLLDELEVMATGHYTVDPTLGSAALESQATASPATKRNRTKQVNGTGQAAARAWLHRLAAMLGKHPDIDISLTPYADPDVQSLTQFAAQSADRPAAAVARTYAAALPPAMRARVSTALAGRPLSMRTAWPVDGAITADTLGALTDNGVRTLVLDATAVSPPDGREGTVPVGVTRLAKHHTALAAALTWPAIQRYAAAVVTRGGGGTSDLPQLVAEIAIRAAEDPAHGHVVVITPPRYVDPDPSAADRAIRDTTGAVFARAASLPAILAPQRLPRGHRTMAARVPTATLPVPVLHKAERLHGSAAALRSLLQATRGTPAVTALLDGLPRALQRLVSSYWRASPADGTAYARTLAATVDGVIDGVHIVQPSSGAYTLASSNASLPITVQNRLPWPVQVRLQVSTQKHSPGFSAADRGAERVEARSKRIIQLPTRIDRSGRILINAQLLTPDRHPLGAPVLLTVKSTVFGVLGIVITAVSGVVLVLALLVRLFLRLRRMRGRRRSPKDTGADSGSSAVQQSVSTP